MAQAKEPIDKVRASRDGHEFHEAWTARAAMRLLLPHDDLVGIAVEGLEPGDQTSTSAQTVEVADLTFYYGNAATFNSAKRIEIAQLKYSIRSQDREFRARHAKKTIEKFRVAYLDHKRTYGAQEVCDKLFFELITNRPIYPAFTDAIKGLAEGKPLSGAAKTQADQFKSASSLEGKPLAEFASKCMITGLAGSLSDTKKGLSRVLVDWSATSDSIAKARLGEMRQMVRDKAGHIGTNKNVIRETDVLAALDLADDNELLPCPSALVSIGEVVEREQLGEALSIIPMLTKPLLIHAAGGVGKTVFLDSLAQTLSDHHVVVFFDCFGGGAYRSPEDLRHLPNRGLVHIVNTLACKSLCDPMLPGSQDGGTLLRTFRRRLEQSVSTLNKASPNSRIIIFLDAIDNAAIHADDRSEDAFPTLLLESLFHNPLTGLKLVVSSRSHRIPVQQDYYQDFKLSAFSLGETKSYILARLPDVKEVELRVAQARSGGNARILEYLLNGKRGLLDPSEFDNIIELEDLIQQRIDQALSDAVQRGNTKADTDAFLAGLAVLPPPVPIEDYAEALGMDVSAIESFASDLWPLLELTEQGLMFRDEPTETLLREKYASLKDPLSFVAANLLAQQESSVYAARALPGLLFKLGNGQQLFSLAFDEQFPEEIMGIVGQRNIRSARLKAAVRHAASQKNYDDLVQFLVEMTTVTSVDQRGDDYIIDYPDLVLAAQDSDATRRLFETRTKWQGTRHARLAIANALSGDADEAYRHTVSVENWLDHYLDQKHEVRMRHTGPEPLDIAAIPFVLNSQNRCKDAANFMKRWKDWYVYEVNADIIRLTSQAAQGHECITVNIEGYLDHLKDQIGGLAAALCFVELDDTGRQSHIRQLASTCRKKKTLELRGGYGREQPDDLTAALRKACGMALALGLRREARVILKLTLKERPVLWSFQSHFDWQYVFPFVLQVALTAVSTEKQVREKDLLPQELVDIGKRLKNVQGDAFRTKLKEKLEKEIPGTKGALGTIATSLSHEKKDDAKQFINNILPCLLTLTSALAGLLSAPITKADKPFTQLLIACAGIRNTGNKYNMERFRFLFERLSYQIITFALLSRGDLGTTSVKASIEYLHQPDSLLAQSLIELVSILAKRQTLHTLAGEEAMKARVLIENENDVQTRVTYYAQLARAIMPASIEEAATYFRVGLEQMDAIGSGDYEFTNELLLFASSVKGEELEVKEFHTLMNICELNLTDESEKFPWIDFGKGLSRVAGCRALAKLARWDDRSKVSLNCTLLPFLTFLVENGKIDPADAVALRRLVDPIEFHECNTGALATVIEQCGSSNKEKLITEVIRLYEEDNHGVLRGGRVAQLAEISGRVLGITSETTQYLNSVRTHLDKIRDTQNEHMNHSVYSGPENLEEPSGENRLIKEQAIKIAKGSNPLDETSFEEAINDFNNLEHSHFLKNEFFEELRCKVSFSERTQYIQILSNLQNLKFYIKLDELQKCKELWGSSSSALSISYKSLGLTILRMHVEDFVTNGHLNEYSLNEISELSGISISLFALELVKSLSRMDISVTASVWLALARLICQKSSMDVSRKALSRLMNSNAANLSSSVLDGSWRQGLYPSNDIVEICSGLIWRMLGSPYAADRWRAAHSLRYFVRFERWSVIDAVVERIETTDAEPFGASELPFYYFHAKLWVLIALDRIAHDEPKRIAKYKEQLLSVICDDTHPHVLMKHFAAGSLLTCIDASALELPSKTVKHLKSINESPFPRLKEKLITREDIYWNRPDTAPQPKSDFHLNYDFQKVNLNELSKIFGKPEWEVKDTLSDIVFVLDPKITSMYDNSGRETNQQDHFQEKTSDIDTHGEQLAWHALFLTASKYLATSPVTDDSIYEDPWNEWLQRYLLTREDGLWLSDGVDRAPLYAETILLEKGEDQPEITGNKSKILDLVGLNNGVEREVVVAGNWQSTDDIKVNVSSVLVKSQKARIVAKQIINEEPMQVWLPTYGNGDNGDEYEMQDKDNCTAWIVWPYEGEGGLDKDDPTASIDVNRRPRIAQKFSLDFALTSSDPFGRIWKNSRGDVLARSLAWGYESKFSGAGPGTGVSFMSSKALLKCLLSKNNSDLLLLIKLQRYEQGERHERSKFNHTVAVVQIKKTLAIEYHKGKVNHLHQNQY